MSSLVLLTSCWWQFTIVPIKMALIKTMTVKVTDISTTLEKTLMATSNEMVISTVTNNSLFLIQSISLHLCLQLTANPGFKLFIMNCSKKYQLHFENWPVERIPYWLNVCLRKEVLPKWSSSKEMILAGELQFNPSTPRSDKHATSPKMSIYYPTNRYYEYTK